MDGKIDAADMRRAAAAPRPMARAGMFTFAVMMGALVGGLAGGALATQSSGLRLASGLRLGPSVGAAQLLPQHGSAPATFADVVDAVRPAVIGVQVKLINNPSHHGSPLSPRDRFLYRFNPAPPVPRPDQTLTTQGSGFFISADGYAVTNNHVVEEDGTIEIQTDDRKTYPARVVGADATTDLALLKVDGRNDFAHVELAERTPRVGDWVLAVGNPFGLGGTVTAGIVSARERDIGVDASDRLIQIDAPINKGDSGGPSFNLDGKVIGVNTMIFSPSGGSIGIAFAIPADTVKTVIAQLRDKGTVTRGWLGVEARPMTYEIADHLGLNDARGALVAEPQADSPAAKAGIARGDVITSIDGAPIKDARELSKTVGSTAPGTTIKLGMRRQGEEKTLTVTLGQFPPKRQAYSTPGSAGDTTGRRGPQGGAVDAPAVDPN